MRLPGRPAKRTRELSAAVRALRQGPPSGPDHPLAPTSGNIHNSPVASLLQTEVTVRPQQQPQGLLGRILSRLHIEKFGPKDPGWELFITLAVLRRLLRRTHPFNDTPAEYAITADPATVIVVGDWGSDHPNAQRVADAMRAEVAAVPDPAAVHVIHLGDVYYSGDTDEYRRNVLAPDRWPVTPEGSGAGSTSWTLNGNHDMYGGGWGYFRTQLADPRFARQRGAGRPTSWFRLRLPGWDLVGLDTAWNRRPWSKGETGVLPGGQADQVRRWARDLPADRRLMLLSHHQPVTAYCREKVDGKLAAKLQPAIDTGRVSAWLWGHEHRCMALTLAKVPMARCVGNGGIPEPAHPADAPIPEPGIWEERACYPDDGVEWNVFGFAVCEFAGPDLTVRYVDQTGATVRTEKFGVQPG